MEQPYLNHFNCFASIKELVIFKEIEAIKTSINPGYKWLVDQRVCMENSYLMPPQQMRCIDRRRKGRRMNA